MHFHHEVHFTVKTITLIEYNMMIAFVTIIVIYFDRHSKFFNDDYFIDYGDNNRGGILLLRFASL